VRQHHHRVHGGVVQLGLAQLARGRLPPVGHLQGLIEAQAQVVLTQIRQASVVLAVGLAVVEDLVRQHRVEQRHAQANAPVPGPDRFKGQVLAHDHVLARLEQRLQQIPGLGHGEQIEHVGRDGPVIGFVGVLQRPDLALTGI
jgi:hypothetical protein